MKEDYRRIALATGSEAGLLILDTREAEAKLQLFAWRNWIQGGASSRVICPVLPSHISDPDQFLEQIEDHNSVPLVIVVSFGTDEWALVSEILAGSACIARKVFQVVDHGGGHLRLDAQPVPHPPHVDGTGSTRLSVVAANRVIAHRTDLPRRLKFRTGLRGGAENLVYVKAESSQERDAIHLPEPVWLRIDGAAPSIDNILLIDVVPGIGHDHWHFAVEPEGARCSFAYPPSGRNCLSRVALVVDRTCPDQDHIQDAFLLAQGRQGAAAYPEFNGEIRKGLQYVLTHYPWPEGARGRLAWFADVADEGVAPLKGVAPIRAWDVRLPDTLLTTRKTLAVASNELTYSPGFDVWDPVDECLFSVADYFADGQGGTVVIVGNSPPGLGRDDDSIARIANVLGFPTIARRGSRWRAALDKLAHAGVRVFYVFLRVGNVPGVDPESFGSFDALQSQVEMALSASLGGNVISVYADSDGVAAGLTEALDRAQEEDVFSSGVILHEFV